MKTKLLILLMAFSTINLMAATTFNYSTSVADQTIDGITVQLRKGSGQNDPAAVTNSTVRLYANNTITIQGQNIKKISLTFAKNPQKDYASMSVDVGILTSGGTSTSATDTRTDIWMGSSNTINFTIGSSGQRVLKTIVIEIGSGNEGEGGSGNEGEGGSGNEGGGGSGENKVITYTATKKLYETDFDNYGIHTDAFNVAISSHTFSDGKGTITFRGNVTTIGNYAFKGCYELTSITIPNSVTTIGDYAFSLCTGLTSVTIGNSVTKIGSGAFSDCSGLTSVVWNAINCSNERLSSPFSSAASKITSFTFGNEVETIPTYLCYELSKLTTVTIPSSVKSIRDHAFMKCDGLTKTNYTGTIADWCKINFSDGASNPIGYSNNFYINDVEIKDLVIPEGVDTIGSYAFDDCFSLTSVAIPNSVTTIGRLAFEGCSGLTSVTIPNSVKKIGDYAFSGCSGLTSVAIPNSVTTIGRLAFEGCSGLTSVTIGNSVETIGEDAFYGCSGLTSVTIPNSVKKIGDYAFDGCSNLTSVTINSNPICSMVYTANLANLGTTSKIGTIFGSQVKEYIIGDSVTTIGNYAFTNCTGLTSVTIGNSVTTIGSYAFYYCSGLTLVTIPNSVTTIGKSAFYGCSGLTKTNYTGTIADWCKINFSNGTSNPISYSNNFYINDVEIKDLVIPEGVDTIGSYAFNNCDGLTSVTIPNSVTTIGEQVFYYCDGLKKTNYTGTIADWCKIKFGNWSANPICYSKNFFINDVEIKDLVIPYGVDMIGSYAFNYCDGLTSVTIPNSVTTIGDGAFNGCTGLTSVTIGNSVTTISKEAFCYCSGLTSVTIPNSVTTISKEAFCYCSGLTSVTIPNSVITIGDSAFYYCNSLTSVTIGNSVTRIEKLAFGYCSGLTSIMCYATNPPSCYTNTYTIDDAFYYVSKSIPVYVPTQSINAYKQAYQWKDFKNILPISDSPKDLGIYTMTTSAIEGTISCNNLSANSPSCAFFAVPTSWNNPFAWVWNENENGHWEPLDYVADNCYAYIIDNYDYLLIADFPINYTPSGNVWDGAVIRQTNDMYLIPGERYTIDEASFISTHQYFLFYSGSEISLTVTPNSGYNFIGWSDGNTDNPRSVVMTRNMTFTAQFANINTVASNIITYTASSQLSGYEGSLTVGETTFGPAITSHTFSNGIGTITCSGEITTIGDKAFYGCKGLTSVTIPNSVTMIGYNAFYGCSGLTSVTIPNSVTTIGFMAFSGCIGLTSVTIGNSVTTIEGSAFQYCTNLMSITIPHSVTTIGSWVFLKSNMTSITCLATTPPTCDSDCFYNVDKSIPVYVPAQSVAAYKAADGWKEFKNILPIGAVETQTDDIVVTASETSVTFIWPANSSAYSYTLVITKDGVVFCTLKFNAQGQLTGIAFAPSRDGAREMASAEMTASGWQFTVTGLNQASKYGYTLDALNAGQQSIKHYEGEFYTDGYTGINRLTIDNAQCTVRKMIIDNQLYIFRDGKTYNAIGGEVR